MNPHGFKISINLQMPTERPDEVALCDECSMKHGMKDDCWEGILPAGELPLPEFNSEMTGREMIDEPEAEKSPSLIEGIKEGFSKLKPKKKGKKKNA